MCGNRVQKIETNPNQIKSTPLHSTHLHSTSIQIKSNQIKSNQIYIDSIRLDLTQFNSCFVKTTTPPATPNMMFNPYEWLGFLFFLAHFRFLDLSSFQKRTPRCTLDEVSLNYLNNKILRLTHSMIKDRHILYRGEFQPCTCTAFLWRNTVCERVRGWRDDTVGWNQNQYNTIHKITIALYQPPFSDSTSQGFCLISHWLNHAESLMSKKTRPYLFIEVIDYF